MAQFRASCSAPMIRRYAMHACVYVLGESLGVGEHINIVMGDGELGWMRS